MSDGTKYSQYRPDTSGAVISRDFDDLGGVAVDQYIRGIVRGEVCHDPAMAHNEFKRDTRLEKLAVGVASFENPSWADEIRYIRTRLLGMGRPALARAVGVGGTTLARWETGTTRPTAAHLAAVRRLAFDRIKEHGP